MNNEINFETFLYISNQKISISVKKNESQDLLYENNENKNDNHNSIQINQLNEFLEANIFKIEKKINQFVKDIILIIDRDEFLEIKLSLIKKNFENTLKKEDLTVILKDAKNQIKDNYKNMTIVHMIIDKYLIDNKYFSHIPDLIKCQNFSVDLNFICLSDELINEFEKILNNYQIKTKKILSGQYIKKHFEKDLGDIYSMSYKIIDGHNENEIKLVPKKRENKGFFEKFFNFFS